MSLIISNFNHLFSSESGKILAMHRNFFTFKADSHFDLGKQMGTKFKKEVRLAIEKNRNEGGFEKRIKTAAKMLTLTEKHFPDYIEEVRGYSEGSETPLAELWTLVIEGDAYIEEGAYGKCTTLITNKGKLLAHSEDNNDSNLENDVCIVKKTIKGLTTLEIYYYNTLGGVSVGLNSNGFASSGNTLIFNKLQLGIPKGIIGRMILDTDDPVSDFEKIRKLKLADGYNHNIIDTQGKVVNIELTPTDSKISYPPSPFTHTNHCLILKNANQVDDIAGTLSRLEMARNKISANLTVPEVEEVLENNSLGEDKSINNKRTVGRMIVDFESFNCYIWLLREKELGWVKYPIDFINK